MAQPIANREPTMEEILASIRRIIENNDVAEDRQADAAGEVEDTLALEDEITIAAAGGGARDSRATAPAAATSSSAPPVARSSSGPVSLAEVAARVRASGSSAALVRPSAQAAMLSSAPAHGNAAVRIDELTVEEADEFELADQMRPALKEAPSAGGPETVAAAAAETETTSRAERQPGDEPEAVAAADAQAAEAEAEAVAGMEGVEAALKSELEDVFEAAGADRAASDVPAEPERPAPADDAHEGHRETDRALHLISASAEAKVAAAFGDLNDAFAAGPRRSFDEMAEEMLRPMLQQWLDDNLPTLVEKLVREEIERVARGERR